MISQRPNQRGGRIPGKPWYGQILRSADQGTLGPMLWLALPVLAEQLLTMMVGYTDWWLAGHYLREPSYLAAMGLMAYVLWLLPTMFSAVALGATAMVARFVGGGETEAAERVANQAVLVGLVFALLATLVTTFAGSAFVDAMQLEEDAAEHATAYLWILVPVLPAIMMEQIGIACLRGAGDTVSGFVAKTIVNLINVVVSAALVIGWGPFPQLGWIGLAVGTACGHGVGGLILACLLLAGRAGLRIRFHRLTPDLSLIRRLLRIGIPGGLDYAVILACHLIYVAIINRVGTAAAAAHGLGIAIESMAYLPATAFQVAAMTMAGQMLGARDPRRAVSSGWLACCVGGGLLTGAGLLFFFTPTTLTTFFTGTNDPTAQTTIPLLRVVAFAMPSLAITMILAGALRGAGDTRWPLAISLVGYLGIRIPGACFLAWDEVTVPWTTFVLPGCGWGVLGAWYAMLADTLLRSVLVVARFCHGGWKRIKV